MRTILLLGLFLRLLAAFFSRGYAFTDDHYFVIEEAQQWIMRLKSHDFCIFPTVDTTERLAHGSLYTYIHYLGFSFYQLIEFTDPMMVMLTVRIIHAFYSLSIVFLGYKILEKLAHKQLALKGAWILSVAWFMPFLSVRNLVEMVCIPPLMLSVYLYLNDRQTFKNILLVGFFASLAFALRFQTILFSGILGVLWIFQGRFKDAIFLLLGFVLGSVFFLGFIDYQLFGLPFHDLISYVEYNSTHAGEYPNGPWYQYILLFMGMFLLFLGGNWFAAIWVKGRKWGYLLFPILAFVVFHSYFPNKQERFILPVIPFLVILGCLSWDIWSKTFTNHKFIQYDRFSQKFFWYLNIPLLLFLTMASTKTAKIDAMYELQKLPNFDHFAIETSHKENIEFMPRFYGKYWNDYQHIVPECKSDCFFDSVSLGRHPFPNYVLFFDTNDLSQRVHQLKGFAHAERICIVESSWLDRLIPKLNPIVKSQHIQIWKTDPILPASTSTTSIKASAASKSAKSAGRTTEPSTAESTSSEK